jgi:hypothetical protein
MKSHLVATVALILLLFSPTFIMSATDDRPSAVSAATPAQWSADQKVAFEAGMKQAAATEKEAPKSFSWARRSHDRRRHPRCGRSIRPASQRGQQHPYRWNERLARSDDTITRPGSGSKDSSMGKRWRDRVHSNRRAREYRYHCGP